MFNLIPFVACYANDNDAYIPEVWAARGLEIMEENMVAGSLVSHDFENEVAKFGDVVNTRKPGTFKVRRKTDSTTLTQQDASSTNVQVPLDQWFVATFTIKDGEGSKSFQELTNIYLRPAMQAIARGADRAVLGRLAHSFLGGPTQRAGRLNSISSTYARDWVLDAREKLNVNKAPEDGRALIMAPTSETAMLKTDLFMKANERGDGGTALERAKLGHILGFDTYMAQNVNSIASGADISATAITLTEPYAAGTTGALACASIATEAVDGEYFVVSGNDQPTYFASHVDSTSVTLNEALKNATLDNAVCYRYKKCDVKGDYAAGYSEGIILDGYTTAKGPQVGQLVSFSTGSTRRTYTIIEADENIGGTEMTVYLDRPLAVLLTDGDLAFPGPYGSFNIALHRNAFALVTRPLALPRAGVLADVAVYNDLAMRVSMQYAINSGGTIVVCDILAGTAVLDLDLAVPLLG